jgi:hypothetical protein
MSNFFDRTGLSQKQHYLGVNLGSQINFPILYHGATLSFSLKCIFRDKHTYIQRWANLDQASKHLEVFRFRDLSPTPIP